LNAERTQKLVRHGAKREETTHAFGRPRCPISGSPPPGSQLANVGDLLDNIRSGTARGRGLASLLFEYGDRDVRRPPQSCPRPIHDDEFISSHLYASDSFVRDLWRPGDLGRRGSSCRPKIGAIAGAPRGISVSLRNSAGTHSRNLHAHRFASLSRKTCLRSRCARSSL
jgi:hypothetical protein